MHEVKVVVRCKTFNSLYWIQYTIKTLKEYNDPAVKIFQFFVLNSRGRSWDIATNTTIHYFQFFVLNSSRKLACQSPARSLYFQFFVLNSCYLFPRYIVAVSAFNSLYWIRRHVAPFARYWFNLLSILCIEFLLISLPPSNLTCCTLSILCIEFRIVLQYGFVRCLLLSILCIEFFVFNEFRSEIVKRPFNSLYWILASTDFNGT